jgi:hypothetical protein
MGWRDACNAHGTRSRNVSRERHENNENMNKENGIGR